MDQMMFDDQRQPLPDWIEKLAESEEVNVGSDDVDETGVHKTAKYNGITSTWGNGATLDRSFMGYADERSTGDNKSELIKDAKQAEIAINKIAKAIKSSSLYSVDFGSYHEKLKSENPQAVVRALLSDLEHQRVAKRTGSGIRVAAKDDKEDIKQMAVIPKSTFRSGRRDKDVEGFLKESLLNNPDLSAAKKAAEEKFGADRVKEYLKEAKSVIDDFIKFVKRDVVVKKGGDLLANTEFQGEPTSNRESSDVSKQANMALHHALDQGSHISNVQKDLIRSFGNKVASATMASHNEDVNDGRLGFMYLKLSKIAAHAGVENPFNDKTKIDTQREAMRILNFAKKTAFIDDQEITKTEAKLKRNGNANIIRAFLTTTKARKRIASEKVEKIVNIALKYASSEKKVEIKKYAGDTWYSSSKLVDVLADNILITSKKAFRAEVEGTVEKSANDANSMLSRTNLNPDEGDQRGMLDIPFYSAF